MADDVRPSLIDKLRALPAEQLAAVEEFVDLLRGRKAEGDLTTAASTASAPAFASVWANTEDDVYDAL